MQIIMPQEIILRTKNLQKAFGKDLVLKGIDLVVPRGENISIIGRSGCGKTTLLRCIAGLEIISNGEIIIDNVHFRRNEEERNSGKSKELSNRQKIELSEIRTQVGFLFQDLNLFPHKNVLENVSLAPIVVNRVSKEEARFQAMKYLEKVGMHKQIYKMPFELSGGQAQRVAIARALAMEPKIMLYDEPTSALDPELVGEILQVMKELKNDNMTQIVVTHLLRFSKVISDEIIFMDNGIIVERNTPEIIFNNPKDQRTSKYLSSLLQ